LKALIFESVEFQAMEIGLPPAIRAKSPVFCD